MVESLLVRLNRFIDKSSGPDECWPWTTSCTRDGTPIFPEHIATRKGMARSARRLYFNQISGEDLSKDLVVWPTCRSKRCMNPAHFAITPLSELRTTTAKRNAKCRSGRHDLTDPANVRIRANGSRAGCLPCLREKQREWNLAHPHRDRPGR